MIFFERKLKKQILSYIKRKEIISIRGPRQAGKTTLMKMIEDEIKKRYDTVFINLDIPQMRRNLRESPLDFANRYKGKKKLIMFLDEVQRLKSGEALKIIFDEYKDIKLIISGSSTLEIKSNILPFLVGRIFLFELFSFDFYEYVLTKDKGLAKVYEDKHRSLKALLEKGISPRPPSFSSEFLKLWKNYVIFGGYAEVLKTKNIKEKKMILNSIKNIYIEKDIISFFKIEETEKFEDLLKMLAFNAGSIMSYSSLSSDLKLAFRKVDKFIEILRNTYIVHPLRSFHKNMVTEIKKSPKAYFLDLGMRNSIINNFSDFDSRSDNGAIAENFILRELLSDFRDYDIRYWRTAGKAEVDFVLSKGKDIIPIEVKLKSSLSRGFYSFLNVYKPKIAIVATLDRFEKRLLGNTKVFFIPLFYF